MTAPCDMYDVSNGRVGSAVNDRRINSVRKISIRH
jgi:hypothetical protein